MSVGRLVFNQIPGTIITWVRVPYCDRQKPFLSFPFVLKAPLPWKLSKFFHKKICEYCLAHSDRFFGHVFSFQKCFCFALDGIKVNCFSANLVQLQIDHNPRKVVLPPTHPGYKIQLFIGIQCLRQRKAKSLFCIIVSVANEHYVSTFDIDLVNVKCKSVTALNEEEILWSEVKPKQNVWQLKLQ